MKYICIDLEATCSESDEFPRDEMETIEIGAVIVDSNFEVIDEFGCFVRPIRHPKLTEFCTGLTTIKQEQVDSADTFPEVWSEFRQWLGNYSDYIWVSWGDYDRNQIIGDLIFHEMQDNEFVNLHQNAKKLFSKKQEMRSRVGLKGAVTKFAGLEWQGAHHRGIDDAKNLARLMPYIFGDKKIER